MASTFGKGKNGKGKLKLSPKLVKRLAKWAEALVMDESTKLGSVNSLQHKLVAQLRKYASVRYALAGRPFGRDPTMLWAQHFLVDDGETLGETLGIFRSAFFTEKQNHWDPKGYAKDYEFKTKLQPQLARMIQHRSITYSADECIDLPKVVPIREVVHFPEEASVYYKRVLEDVIAAKGNFREMENAFLRMRQISSGFLGLKDDSTGERIQIEFAENPKLERLIELIEALPEGRKALVFYDFTASGRKIVSTLKKELDINAIWLWSGTKDSKKELGRFANDKDCSVACVQNRVGAFSLDGLQDVANYALFFESPISVIDRSQAEARLVRQGQERTVFQYDLCVKNTADERILDLHAEGKSLFDALLKDPEKALGMFK